MEVITESYFKTLVDRTTCTIKRAVPEFLYFLFYRYGIIEDEGLREKEEEFRGLNYELINPILTIFNSIKDLRDLGIAVNNQYLEQQLVKYRVKIVKNTDKFEHDLRVWHRMTRFQRK